VKASVLLAPGVDRQSAQARRCAHHQEIGELREPERVNVPWVIEDIIDLLVDAEQPLPTCET
jgi:hypothetical protein